MALDRKFGALLDMEPDVAIVSECAQPQRLRARLRVDCLDQDPVWVGRNPHKGLAVFAFKGYRAHLSKPYYRALHDVAPVHITGPVECNLLAVWAQNASEGGLRKERLGPLQTALGRYKRFLMERPSLVVGDLNNNVMWDKRGWRMNHTTAVETMRGLGLLSAYHAIRDEAQGCETTPTLYWRDRKKDGPTYHIDYVFLPAGWVDRVTDLRLGTFEDWCGSGLSDHVPVIVDVDV